MSQRNQGMTQRERGFTLLEMLLGLALLALMMVLIYSSLNFGLRAWNTGDARVTEASHLRIVDQFLRRELGQVFPVRWRGIPDSKIAFEGGRAEMRFVTTLNIGAATGAGGLQWGHLWLASDEKDGERFTTLYLKRERFDTAAKGWEDLTGDAKIKPVKLVTHVKSMEIDYFGAENDTAEARWASEWNQPLRVPQLVRITLKLDHGRDIPPIVIALRLGEEAGCYEANFARQCGARRT